MECRNNMRATFASRLKRSLYKDLLIFSACAFCGCISWSDPLKQGLYFDRDNVDFGVVAVSDTSYNGPTIINNTNNIYIIQKPRLAHGINFWIIRNFRDPIDTIKANNGDNSFPVHYNNFPSLGFVASAPGTYRDSLLIFSYPDSTHLLLSEPLVVICR